MARPRFADRGYGLQIWRVARNVLHKQTSTDDRGLSSSLRDVRVAYMSSG